MKSVVELDVVCRSSFLTQNLDRRRSVELVHCLESSDIWT